MLSDEYKNRDDSEWTSLDSILITIRRAYAVDIPTAGAGDEMPNLQYSTDPFRDF